MTLTFPVQLPPETIEEIAKRAAEIVLARLGEREPEPSPFLTIAEAAPFLRCKRQRVDDLLSSRRLLRYHNGRRAFVSREELRRYVDGR